MNQFRDDHEEHGIINDNEDGEQYEDEENQYMSRIQKQNKRPDSNHGRTPVQGQPRESDDMYKSAGSNVQSQSGNAVENLSNYVTTHHISLQNFWKSNQIFATLEEFQQFLFEIGIICSEQDLEDFNNDLVEDGLITIQKLCSCIRPWKNEQNVFFEFIRTKSLQLAQSSKKKANQIFKAGKQPRPQSSVSAISGQNRPISGISVASNQSQLTGITEMKMTYEKPLENRSKEYLRQFKDREKQINHLLELTINKGKNQYEYEMLIKMGDANEMNNKLGQTITYRAYKSAKGVLVVHQWDLDQQKGVLSLQEFQREYNAIKNEWNEKHYLDPYVRLSQTKSSKNNAKFKHGSVGKDDIQEKEIPGQGTNANQGEKQTQLKTVLLDTMLLTSILKEQLQVLTSKPVNTHLSNQQSSMNFK